MRRSAAVALLSACATILLSPAAAASLLLDFEALPGGGAPIPGQEVGAAYASLGVRFGSLETDDLLEPYFDRFAGPTLWVTDGGRSPVEQIGFHIYAEFAAPVSSVSFDALGAAEFSIEAHALDELGNEIGVVASPPLQAMIKGRFTLRGDGPISSVFWIADSPFVSSVSIDNLEIRFVPEPSTATLLLLGFAGCSAYRRRALRRGSERRGFQ